MDMIDVKIKMKPTTLKFRYYDPFNQAMTYSENMKLSRFFEIYEKAKEGDNNPVLMQYTGLKEKNGKEIYQGGLVKTLTGHKDNLESIFEVVFQCGSFQLKRLGLFPGFLAFITCVVQLTDEGHIKYDSSKPKKIETDLQEHLEIIGNIHEHPELLK